jgi:hypothetical protein
MPKPIKLPTWATSSPNILEPSEGKKAQGWVPGEQPPASFFNYWQNLVHEWVSYLDAERVAEAAHHEQVRAEIYALCNLQKGAIPPAALFQQAASDPTTGRVVVTAYSSTTIGTQDPNVLLATSWSAPTASGNIQKIKWVPFSSRFIGYGTASVLRSSPDGGTWTTITPGGTGVYGTGDIVSNGAAILVQIDSQDVNRSTDGGVTWTRTPAALPVGMAGTLAYGANLFVAPSMSTTNVYTSPNGVTWTPRALPAGTLRYAGAQIAYLAGVGFVMVNPETAGTHSVYQSPDGLTWTRTLDLGADGPLYGCLFATESAIYQTMGGSHPGSRNAPDLAFLKDGSVVKFKMTHTPGGYTANAYISYVRRREQRLFLVAGYGDSGTAGEIWSANIGTVM